MNIIIVGFIVVVAFTIIVSADKLSGNEPVPIIRNVQDIKPDGSYEYAYETGNGIIAEEKGQLKTIGSESAINAQGQYSYKSPEGKNVNIIYVADENGFRPEGDVIPKPPPIPSYVIRALEFIAANSPKLGKKI